MQAIATGPRVSALDVSDLHIVTVRLAIRLGLVSALVSLVAWSITGDTIGLAIAAGSVIWSALGRTMVVLHRRVGALAGRVRPSGIGSVGTRLAPSSRVSEHFDDYPRGDRSCDRRHER